MKDLKLAEVLRNILPGAAFMLTALAVHPGLRFGKESGFFEATAILGLALLFGATIQCTHRALIHPLVHRFLLYCFFRFNPPVASVTALQQICLLTPTAHELEFFRKKVIFERDYPAFAQWFYRWADQTHFLWATAWATLAGYLVPECFGFSTKPEYIVPIRWTVFLLFFVAFVDNVRGAQMVAKLQPELEKEPADKRL